MRHTIRMFARSPLSTLAAIGALALAIGASTLVFSVLDGVLIRDLPYRDPARLVAIWEANIPRGRWTTWWRRQTSSSGVI